MNTPDDQDLFQKIYEAQAMQDGPAKCSVLEEIVRLADTQNDIDAGYEARTALVQASNFSGYPEISLVAFTWCLAQFDQHPDRFDLDDLLWKYKWIVNSLLDFPQISMRQMDDALEDLRKRYERAGYGDYAYHLLRLRRALTIGDDANLPRYYELWKKASRDRMSDCLACVQNLEVRYAVRLQDDEKAWELAQPLLNGRMRCQQVPHTTYGHLLKPLVRLQWLDKAVRLHKTGYRMIASNATFLADVGKHMNFLSVTDNLARASRLLEKHLIWALQTAALDDRFHFYLACQFLLERMRIADQQSLKLRLPRLFPLYQRSGQYELADLHAWFGQESQELAGRFDQRNGTDAFASDIAALQKFHALAKPYPFR